jgi:hypothetical protein
VEETDQTCRCNVDSRRLRRQACWLAHFLLPHTTPQRMTLHCTPQSTHLHSRSAMNRVFRCLRLTSMAVEKTPDGLAVNQSTRRTAAPDSATSRAIYTPGADLYNKPCSIWTMEVLSRIDLPSDTERSKF